MKMSKKVLSILLAVLMLAATMAVCAVPVSALGATGACGTNVTWSFDASTGALTIGGSGQMYTYHWRDNPSPFDGCDEIRTVNIDNGVTSLGEEAFNSCRNLTTVNLAADTLKGTGYYTFCGCSSLTEIKIPEGVEKIGAMSFSYCSSMKKIWLPRSLASINSNAFYKCSALTDVYYAGTAEDWNKVQIVNSDSPVKSATMHYNSELTCVLVRLNADPAGSGTFIGHGRYVKNTPVTVAAVPKTGYVFDGWYKNGSKVSTTNPFTFTASADATYTAKFKAGYTVTVNLDPANGGTVTGGGGFEEGATTTLTATPNPGYHFVGFIDETGERWGNLSPTFSVTENMTLTAKFVNVAAIPTIKNSTTTLNDGDWYFDKDALIAAFAAGFNLTTEEASVMLADIKIAKYDPQSGVIVLMDASGDADGAVVALPEDGTAYDLYKAGIKQYHAPTQPESVCPWCGGQHNGFFQGIIGFFHGIFAKLFGARY